MTCLTRMKDCEPSCYRGSFACLRSQEAVFRDPAPRSERGTPERVDVIPSLSPSSFLSDPGGRYCAGRTWFVCCPGGGLAGTTAWGTPDEKDVRAWATAARGFTNKHTARFLDVRRVKSVGEPVFAAVVEHIAATTRSAQVRGAVIVQEDSLLAATASGFSAVSASRSLVLRTFTDLVPALAWLGHASPAELARELDTIEARAIGSTPLLRDVRAALSGRVGHADIKTVASALGVSIRSLQRRLAEEGTSFRAEVGRARLLDAERLLRETDASVAEVALEVGFASAQHLALVFRRGMGTTPTCWRARARAAPTIPRTL
jgi:AraC-like DNA-binding protein